MKRIVFASLLALGILFTVSGCASSKEQLALRNKGIEQFTNASYKEAVETFDKALSLSMTVGKTEKDICYYKAISLFCLKDYKKAEEVYSALIAYDENAWEPLYLRGLVYLSSDDATRAKEDFNRALSLHEKDYDFYIRVAGDLEANNEHEAALDILNKALHIGGDGAKDELRRGEILSLIGQYDESQKAYKKAEEKGERIALLYLAKAAADRGNFVDANNYIETVSAWNNLRADELAKRGEVYMRLGDYDKALSDFQKGQKKEEVPAATMAQLKRGEIGALEYTGDFKGALSLAQSYLKDYPDDRDISREIVFLQSR